MNAQAAVNLENLGTAGSREPVQPETNSAIDWDAIGNTSVDLSPEEFEAAQSVFRIGKPNKQDFVRAHSSDIRRGVLAIEYSLGGERREIYLVAPGVVLPADVAPLACKVILVRAITHRGPNTQFVWYFKDTQHPWSLSSFTAVRKAQTTWVRVVANQANSNYDMTTSGTAEIPEPVWSKHSFSEIIALACGEDRLIKDSNHPVILSLQGKTHGFNQ